MTPETLQSVLKRRPYQAFQIRTRGGEVYPIGDPDLVRISGTTLTLLAAGDPTSWVAVIDLDSVTSLTLCAPTPETP